MAASAAIDACALLATVVAVTSAGLSASAAPDSVSTSCVDHLWPSPKTYTCGSGELLVSPRAGFTVQWSSGTPSLSKAVEARFLKLVFEDTHPIEPFREPAPPSSGVLTGVDIHLDYASESLQLETSEAYTLRVPAGAASVRASLRAPTIFGAVRGLETLSQLISSPSPAAKGPELLFAPVEIADEPRFPHRGILLDTSRNFYSVSTLEHLLDSMAWTKLNVLHWHISDSQSFPMAVPSHPDFARRAAYSAQETYTAAQTAHVVEYARVRGIRVIPEFDAPGHVFSWSLYKPELVLCADRRPWFGYCAGPPCGQLDPSKPETYALLQDIWTHSAAVFPDRFVHLGADEVNFPCWNETEALLEWRQRQGLADWDAVFELFEKKEHAIVHKLNKQAMVWEEPFLHGLEFPASTVVQVWNDYATLVDAVKAGRRVVLSNANAWYLDCGRGSYLTGKPDWCQPYKSWQVMYMNDPVYYEGHDWGFSDEEEKRILGGEACQWSAQTDDSNLESNIWPRVNALAEKLWSPRESTADWRPALKRIWYHRERMVTRGIRATPIQPKWCRLHPDSCAEA